jgi:hypothetical protein
VSADLAARRERLAAPVRARRPATQADWLALADEDEWLALLESGGIAPHEWAEMGDERRARAGRAGGTSAGRDATNRR